MVSLQVDYDSEEEEEEQEEEQEDEDLDEAEESKNRKSRSSQVEIQNQNHIQSRVNSVLQSHTAVESYRYDVEHELWCEVSLHQVFIKSSSLLLLSEQNQNHNWTPQSLAGFCVFERILQM